MSTDLVAGSSVFGETDGTGTGASFHWHADVSLSGGILAITTWDGQFATGAFLDTPGVGYVSNVKVRTLNTATLNSATPAPSISSNSERWSGNSAPFQRGFRTVPTAIGEGPTGMWLVGFLRGSAEFAGLTAGQYGSLPVRTDPHVTTRRWATVDKTSGATVETASQLSPNATPIEIVASGADFFGLTNIPSLCDRLDSTGAYLANVDLSVAMDTETTALGISAALGGLVAATTQGSDTWAVTDLPGRLWRFNGGPTGTANVILLASDAATDPGATARMPGGFPQAVAVTATKIFVIVRDGTLFGNGTSALWRIDRTSLAAELIAGLGTSDIGDPPSMAVDGSFVWVAQTYPTTTQIFRIPVTEPPIKGWTTGSIAMT